MEIIDRVQIEDKLGFIYRVMFKHHPNIGVSIAYYEDERIASAEYGRMLPPTSDDDGEWEEWEERFREWADGPIANLDYQCKEYFNKKLK